MTTPSNQFLNKWHAYFFVSLLMLLLGISSKGFAQSSGNIDQMRKARLEALNQKSIPSKHPLSGLVQGVANNFTVQASNSNGLTLQSIVQSLVGTGVTISNVQCNVPDSLRAVGAFSGGTALFGVDNGLLMTTGSVDNAIGPNKTTFTSQDNGMDGYLPMDTLGFDATIIDFDLVSSTNLMTFKYVFASEEYNEYVGSVFNDQFSFFITGPGYSTPTNIALIPGSTTPVAINNVNLGLNAVHYINNDTLDGLIPADINRFSQFEYDGLTRVLTTTSLNLIPGATYHLKLVIQDVGDHVYDSGVFIEGGSITSDTCVMKLYTEVVEISDTGNGFDGSIELYISGSNGTPQVLWNNGSTSMEIEHLGPGTYNVTVTDQAGCVATLPNPIILGGGGGPCGSYPAMPETIDGPLTVCKNSTEIEYSVDAVAGATSYKWTLPTGATGNSTTKKIVLSFGSTYKGGTLSVKAVNECGESASSSINIGVVTLKPASPGVISGIAAGVCESTSKIYSVASVANASSYIWTVPSGAKILNGQGKKSIEVEFDPGFVSGVLSVKASNCVGLSEARTLTLTSVTAIPSSITGPSTSACAGSSVEYSCPPVPGAEFYNWILPTGAVIESGEGTNHIVVTLPDNFISGKVSVSSSTECYTSNPRTLTVYSTPARPGLITGNSLSVCAGSVETFTCPVSTTGALFYDWTAPEGAIITDGQGTNSITVNFTDVFTSGYITVSAGNDCGESLSRTLLVRSAPVAPSKITGITTGACAGSTQTYTCPISTSGASSYIWTVPAGAVINEGQGSNSISVTLPTPFSTGKISVIAENACGQSLARTITVGSVPVQPKAITGQSGNLCGGGVFTYSIATVTGALTYNWILPAGCSIVENNSNSITISVPANFTSGILSVEAVNACGNSVPRTLLLSSLPAIPSVISGPDNVCPFNTNLVFSVSQVDGLSYIWTLPTGSFISMGQGTNEIMADWGSSSGSVLVKAQNSCGFSPVRKKTISTSSCRISQRNSITEDEIKPDLKVYPNPGSGIYYLDIKYIDATTYLSIYDMSGTVIMVKQLDNTVQNQSIDLSNHPSGIYIARIHSGEYQKDIRIIKQ